MEITYKVSVSLNLDWVRGLRKSLRLSKADRRVLRKIFGV